MASGAVDFSGLPQLSVAERVARGKGARREVPRSSHAVFEPTPHRLDPVELLERQADTRVPGARPDPLRADARLAVHLLPRRGADHGRRPGGDAALRVPGPVLRRRAPLELRPLRLARAAARLRHQRLRRDAARAVGVGRQAARGQHADLLRGAAASRSRSRSASCSRPSLRIAPGWPSSRGCATCEVWYTRFEIEKLLPQLRAQVGARMRKRLDKAVAKAFAATACRRSRSSRARSTASGGSSPTRR